MADEQRDSQVENEPTQAELDAAENVSIDPVVEDAAAEAAIADKMSEIFRKSEARQQADEVEEEGLTSPNDPDGTGEVVAEGETEADDSAAGADSVEKDDPAEAAAKAERQEVIDAFDPNLKQIAQELGGWNKENLEDFIAASPVLAKATFSNMAAAYNNLSLQYARGVRPVQAAPTQTQQPGATQTTPSVLDELLANPTKLASLADIAGEELTKAFIRPLLEERLAERKARQDDQAFIQNLRREGLVREISECFSGLTKTGFTDFYGENGQVSKEQDANRMKVGRLADQIRAGAQLQGVAMPVNEAIRRAHLIVTADQTRQQVRREIVGEVKKRSTQITARPTGRKSRPVASRGEDAALAAVESFWEGRD